LDTFQKNILPVVQYYIQQNKVYQVDANRTFKEIYSQVREWIVDDLDGKKSENIK